MINNGVFVRGQKITEADLCERIGVSRTPLREALRALATEGLLEEIPNRGVFVREPSMEEIGQMFEVMAVLEGTCARLATEKMSAADLKKLERLHEKLEKRYQEGDRDLYIEANNEYHSFVQELAGNPVLDEIVRSLRAKVQLYRHQQIFRDRRFEESIAEHRELIAAFREGDPEKSEISMKTHLLKQCRALVGLYGKGAEGQAIKPGGKVNRNI